MKKISSFLLFFIIVLVVISLKYNILNEPYHWDAMGAVAGSALKMYDANLRIIDPSLTFIHPPLMYFPLALLWDIFGYSIPTSHLFILILASVGLIYTYKLGEYLFNSKVGLGAIILLFFNQMFFAQAGTLNDSIPLLTLGVISVYYYLKKRKCLFVLFSVLFLLIKETASLFILAIFFHFLLERFSKKGRITLRDMKESWFILIPFFPLFAWFIYHKLMVGFAFNTFLLTLNNKAFASIILNPFKHFIYDNSDNSVNKYNFIISLFILFSLLRLKRTKLKMIYSFFFAIIFFNTTLFSFALDIPGYFVPILPFFYIIGAHSIESAFSAVKYRDYLYFAVIIMCAFLFTLNYTGYRGVNGWQLQSNMEYLDMIATHSMAAGYISANFPRATVLTCWPMSGELSEPRFGYVSQSVKINEDFNFTDRNIIVYSSEQSSNPNLPKLLDKRYLHLIKRFEKNNKSAEIYRYSR